MSNSPSPVDGGLRAVVVDDEELACRNLRRKLLEVGGVASIETFTDPCRAVERLQRDPPDVVFLDIRMPLLSGFDVLAHFPEPNRAFVAVFCTAYDDRALAAFESAAIDYLVKPVEPRRLAESLARTRRTLSPPATGELGRARVAGLTGWLERVVVRFCGGVQVLDLAEVVAISSEAHHAVAYTRDGEHVLESSLSALEPQLDPSRFVRCHRAHLVQLSHVLAVEGEEVVLAGGRRVPVSRRNRTSLVKRLSP